MDIAIECSDVCKHYEHFDLKHINLTLPTGSVMGFVGPNGAGKSTTMRIIMGLVAHDSGSVKVLGRDIPKEVALAKADVGYVSEDMRLYGSQTLGFHMQFMKSIYPGWDDVLAKDLLKRFDLVAEQKTKGYSHGQRVKSMLLLVLARRPRVLILDEPTTGLDPVARHEILQEMMDVLKDESRSILFSSHNTLDIEQISDHITFVLKGEIIDAEDKETYLENWRRLRVQGVDGLKDSRIVTRQKSGSLSVFTTNGFSDDLVEKVKVSGGEVQAVERMTLEEIFLARVQSAKEGQV